MVSGSALQVLILMPSGINFLDPARRNALCANTPSSNFWKKIFDSNRKQFLIGNYICPAKLAASLASSAGATW